MFDIDPLTMFAFAEYPSSISSSWVLAHNEPLRDYIVQNSSYTILCGLNKVQNAKFIRLQLGENVIKWGVIWWEFQYWKVYIQWLQSAVVDIVISTDSSADKYSFWNTALL